MSSVDYRRYAAELLRIAERVGDHQGRAAFLAMAQSWRHLAAQAEKNLQTVLVYETPEPPQPPVQANGFLCGSVWTKRYLAETKKVPKR